MKRAVSYILGSNLLAQLIVLGSTPFLTRIYSKSDFGWFGVGTAFAILLATLMSLRLEHSIHLEESNASRVYSSCLLAIVLSTVFVFVPIIWLTGFSGIANVHTNSWYMLLFAVGHATHASSILFLNARQQFKAIAVVNLSIPLIFVAGTVFLSHVYKDANALLAWQAIAYALGSSLGVILNIKAMIAIGLHEFARVIKQELDGIRYLVPSSLISTLTLNLPVLITTALFSDTAAGLVVIAQRIARAPITVIGNGLNEVLRSTIPARTTIYATFRRVAQICLGLSAIMLVVTWFVPESVYVWLLGDQWTGLRLILIATVFGAVFQLLGTSVMSLLSSFNKRQEYWINVILLLVGLSAVLVVQITAASYLVYIWVHVVFSAVVFMYSYHSANKIALEYKPTVAPSN